MLRLNEYAKYIKQINLLKGFDGVPSKIDTPEKCKALIYALALVNTEVCEAIEAARDANSKGVAEELADVIIRILHIGAVMEIDLEKAIDAKMKRNEKRPYRHGRKC